MFPDRPERLGAQRLGLVGESWLDVRVQCGVGVSQDGIVDPICASHLFHCLPGGGHVREEVGALLFVQVIEIGNDRNRQQDAPPTRGLPIAHHQIAGPHSADYGGIFAAFGGSDALMDERVAHGLKGGSAGVVLAARSGR